MNCRSDLVHLVRQNGRRQVSRACGYNWVSQTRVHCMSNVCFADSAMSDVQSKWCKLLLQSTASTRCDQIMFENPLALEGDWSQCTVEPWFIWEGSTPLILSDLPRVI